MLPTGGAEVLRGDLIQSRHSAEDAERIVSAHLSLVKAAALRVKAGPKSRAVDNIRTTKGAEVTMTT